MRRSEIVTDSILTSVLALSAIGCLASGMRTDCSDLIILIVPLVSVAFCLLWSIKKRYLPWLISAAAVILSFILFFDNIKYLWYKISFLYTKGYYFLSVLIPKDTSPFPSDMMPGDYLLKAFVFIAVLFCSVTAMSLRRLKKTLPAALIISFGITPCLVLTDTIPYIIPLALFTASFLTLIFSSRTRKTASENYNRSVIFSALISAVLAASVFMLFPKKDFEKQKISFHNFTIEAANIDLNIPDKVRNRFKRHVKESNVDVNELTDLPNDNNTVMTVNTSYTRDIYLRGNAYSDFDGRNWTNDSVYETDFATFSPATDSPYARSVEISTTAVENVIYTPYYISYFKDPDLIKNDSFISNTDGLDSYSFRFAPSAVRADFSPEYLNALDSYEDWVRSNCLFLPDETRNAVLSWLYEHDTSFLSSSDDYYKAESVARLVSTTARYSRSPSTVDKSKDFCEWFLRDAERGYCTHYATVTAAALRAIGIPARLATGYFVKASDYPERTVTGLEAHAWVEARIEGKWVVIEATPAGSVSSSSSAATPASMPSDEATASPTPIPTDTPAPDNTVTPIVTKAAATTPEASVTPEAEAQGSDPSIDSGAILSVLLKIAAAALIVLILPVRRRILLAVRKGRMRSADINNKARLIYRNIIKLRKYTKTPVPVNVKNVARKAAFSKRKLTDVELKAVRDHLENEKKKLKDAPVLKRMFYKYILVLI